MDRLDEGLLGALMNTIFAYAAEKNIENDPEIKAVMKKHQENMARLSKDFEEAMKKAAPVFKSFQAKNKKNG